MSSYKTKIQIILGSLGMVVTFLLMITLVIFLPSWILFLIYDFVFVPMGAPVVSYWVVFLVWLACRILFSAGSSK